MKTRVLIDAQIFRLQRRGGISRYFVELLRRFENPALGVDALTPFRIVRNEHLVDAFPADFTALPAGVDRVRQAMTAWPALRDLAQRWLGRRDRAGPRLDVDLVHHTYYLPLGAAQPAGPRVCTVYDMIPELYPDHFPGGNPHREKQRYVRDCNGVIAISETTRRDMERFYGDLGKPVQVIHLGVGDEFARARGQKSRFPWPYLLFVGQRSGYKNGGLVLRAWRQIAQEDPLMRLILVGGGPLTTAERDLVDGSAGADRVVLVNSSDEGLPALYAGASAFVFPSLYEGFGLPVLEAFAAGTPALLAKNDCLLEVGSDAAQYFTPDSPDQLADLVLTTTGDAHRSALYRRLGSARAAEFSWDSTAQKTADFYRHVLDSSA